LWSRRAVAAPMPLLAPVITATRFALPSANRHLLELRPIVDSPA
jgi:hypothetical protein